MTNMQLHTINLKNYFLLMQGKARFFAIRVLFFGFLLSTSQALVIKDGGNQNFRFFDPSLGSLYYAPANPIFIGKDYDLSGVSVNSDAPNAAGTMISQHYFMSATHYRPGTILYFRNRDGQLITKAIDGGRLMYRNFPNLNGAESDLWIGRLAGAGVTAADKISTYPVIMESANNWNWYVNKQILVCGNGVGINTIGSIGDSGVLGRIGKSIFFTYSGAYTNQAGVNGESGNPWGVIWNGQFIAAGTHSGYFGTASVNTTFTTISTLMPAYADQIDAYIAESYPNEKLTRRVAANNPPEITVQSSLTLLPGDTSKSIAVTVQDDNLPTTNTASLSAISSNQTILPDSSLVLSGSGVSRTLTITPSPNNYGTVTISLVAYDGLLTTTKSIAVTLIGTTAILSPIVSADDADQVAAGSVTLDSTDLQLGTNHTIGLRFPNLLLPSGAIITSASVQLASGPPQAGPTMLEIAAQNNGLASTFTAAANNISSRPITSTSVFWQPADWNSEGERGIAQRTPDLSAVVQEVVSTENWTLGNSLVLLIKGSGQRKATALDKSGGMPAQLNVTYVLPRDETSVVLNVNSSANDAEQSADGTVVLNSNDLELVNDSVTGNQTVGLRFDNVTVPAGAELTYAALQFATGQVSSGTTSLQIQAQASDNAQAFTATANNLSSRSKTIASVPWQVANWLTVGEQGFAQLTPDLTPALSEVVARPGWVSGNALALLITGTGRRTAYAFDNVAALPARLNLTYTAPRPYSYGAWKNSFTALTTSQKLPDADPDNDQISNLMEFALGLNPTSSNILPISLQSSPSQFNFIYSRPRLISGLTYVVEWSDDLAINSWSQIGVVTQVIGDDGTMQTIRAVLPMLTAGGGVAPRRFARLRVSLPPAPITTLRGESFEIPAVTSRPNSLQRNPAGNPWVFTSNAYIQANGSTFGAFAAPDGIQTAALQGSPTGLGAISQTLNLSAGTYIVNFIAARGQAPFDGSQPVKISIDGIQVGSVIGPATNTFSSISSELFTVTAGNHTLRLEATTASSSGSVTLIDQVSIEFVPPPSAFTGGSFEAPAVSGLPNRTVYQPKGSPWIFRGLSLIQANGGIYGAPAAPDGIQSAILQGAPNGLGSISQTINLASGTYSMSFKAARRSGQIQPVKFSVDGVQVGGLISAASAAFSDVATDSFTVTAGTHTVRFEATDATSDNSIFIDQVTLDITAPPAPFAGGSFETPAVSSLPNRLQSNPTGSPWAFASNAYIQANGSLFGAAAAPDGIQTAVLQGAPSGLGSIRQTISLADGTYRLRFAAARRGSEVQPVKFSVDGTRIGSTITANSSSFSNFATGYFTVIAGSHTVRLEATDGTGDKSVFIDQVTLEAVSPFPLPNSSFEVPDVSSLPGRLQYSPLGSSWIFSNSGIQANGGAFGAAAAPNGVQTAVLQGTPSSLGVCSQTLNFPANTYIVRFEMARRSGQIQPVKFSVDGTQVGATLVPTSDAFTGFVTAAFTVAAGNHTLRFEATDGTGDKSVFIDQVAIEVAP